MSANAPRSGGKLRIGLDWEVDVIDPPASFGGWNTGRVVQQMFESLVEDDLSDEASPVSRLIPALAEDFEVSADGRRYLFRLRQGVRFHDGTPFDAEAAKFNLERMWNPAAPQFSGVAADYNRIGVEAISELRVRDMHELEVELKEPFPEFLRYMTQEDAPGAQVFISPTALSKFGNDGIGDRAPGTGPFRFGRRFATDHGSGVDLVRNDDYWGGTPYLDGLQFVPLPDMDERTRALVDGEIDLAYGLDGADLAELADRGFVVRSGPVPYVWYFIFNMDDPYLSDRRVRHAIAHGFNRQRLSDTLFGGQTRPASGMLPPASPSFDPDFEDPYLYDPEKARALLAEAGVPGDWTLKITFAVAGSAQLRPLEICRHLASDLGKVGLKVELAPHADWIAYCNEWRSGMPGDIGMSEMSWGMSCDVWLDQVLHSRNLSPKGFNAGHFADPNVDNLLDRARTELNEEARIGLYRSAHARIMEELPVLPVVTVHSGTVVHHPRVRGFKYPKQNWHCFHRVWFSDN